MKSYKQIPQFFAANHLTSLCKQLRFAGFDCHILENLRIVHLPPLPSGSKRFFLTRSRQSLPEKFGIKTLRIHSTKLEEQMVEVALNIELEKTFAPFTRCTLCNVLLKNISPIEVSGMIPDRVLDGHDDFRQCPDCKRVYWKGDHYRRMTKRWEEIFEKISRLQRGEA